MRRELKEEVERELISHSNAKLADKRDPEAWENPTYEQDKQFKKQRGTSTSQHGINYVIQAFKQYRPETMRLTIGRSRL